MRVFVNCPEESLTIPCGDGSQRIQWLKEDILRRVHKASSPCDEVIKQLASESKLLLVGPDSKLDDNDLISEVLDDKDFIRIVSSNARLLNGLENDRSERDLKQNIPIEFIELDGNSLKPNDLLKLGNRQALIKGCDVIRILKLCMEERGLGENAMERIKQSRALLDQFVSENKVVYGLTTGFGKFAKVTIPQDKLKELQINLIRSHACGVGEPLPPERARMMFALRINVLAKGYSGISLPTLNQMIDCFNAACVSWVPEQGTVGASGDLAPLAHLALGMLGEGKMWSPKSGWADAKMVLDAYGLKPLTLGAKEGIALINGTQLITALGAEAFHDLFVDSKYFLAPCIQPQNVGTNRFYRLNQALERAKSIARQADVVAALSLEVLKGSTRAFSEEIHAVRPHKGQKKVAKTLRSLLHSDIFPSQIAESHRFCNKVQDAYTLRCCPQVHGIVHDTVEFVRGIITTEMNSATDNPMVFVESGETLSGGNFHGEYPAKALDYLAIGVHELANMSERRLERLINPALQGTQVPFPIPLGTTQAYSELPAFLVDEGGFNSGLMMAQVTAAALVSENKVYCHPSSVDSLTTSAGTEDHVSMGGFAARKVLKVVENVERVIAIELMAACQGIEFLRPLLTTEPLEAVYKLVRQHCKVLEKDRYMAPDMENITKLLREEKVWKTVQPYIDNYKKLTTGENAQSESRSGSPTATSMMDDVPAFKKMRH